MPGPRLTAVLISRFMLNLQAVDNKALRVGSHVDTLDDSFWRNSSVIFNERILGSLESLVIDDARQDDDETAATEGTRTEGTAETRETSGEGAGRGDRERDATKVLEKL